MRKIIPLTPVIFALYGLVLVCIGFFSKNLGTVHLQQSIAHALKYSHVSSKHFFKSFFYDTLFGNQNFFNPDTYNLNHHDKVPAIFAFIGCIFLLFALFLFLLFVCTLIIHRSFIRTSEVISNRSNKPATISSSGKSKFFSRKQQSENAANEVGPTVGETKEQKKKGFGFFKFGKNKQAQNNMQQDKKHKPFSFFKKNADVKNNQPKSEKKWKSFFHRKNKNV